MAPHPWRLGGGAGRPDIFTGTSARRYLAEGTHLILPVVNTVSLYQTRVDSLTMSVMQGADGSLKGGNR